MASTGEDFCRQSRFHIFYSGMSPNFCGWHNPALPHPHASCTTAWFPPIPVHTQDAQSQDNSLYKPCSSRSTQGKAWGSPSGNRVCRQRHGTWRQQNRMGKGMDSGVWRLRPTIRPASYQEVWSRANYLLPCSSVSQAVSWRWCQYLPGKGVVRMK